MYVEAWRKIEKASPKKIFNDINSIEIEKDKPFEKAIMYMENKRAKESEVLRAEL